MFDAEDRLARINACLIALIIAVCLYVALAPFAPQIYFLTDRFAGQSDRLTRLLRDSTNPKLKTTYRTNQLIAPHMMLQAQVIDSTAPVVGGGVWRLPTGSTPDKGGNTILVANRFSYSRPRGEFYFINRLKPKDELGVTWQGKSYKYQVLESRTISASDANPFKDTVKPTITLYTATPLWSQTKRWVVTAQLVGKL